MVADATINVSEIPHAYIVVAQCSKIHHRKSNEILHRLKVIESMCRPGVVGLWVLGLMVPLH